MLSDECLSVLPINVSLIGASCPLPSHNGSKLIGVTQLPWDSLKVIELWKINTNCIKLIIFLNHFAIILYKPVHKVNFDNDDTGTRCHGNGLLKLLLTINGGEKQRYRTLRTI